MKYKYKFQEKEKYIQTKRSVGQRKCSVEINGVWKGNRLIYEEEQKNVREHEHDMRSTYITLQKWSDNALPGEKSMIIFDFACLDWTLIFLYS